MPISASNASPDPFAAPSAAAIAKARAAVATLDGVPKIPLKNADKAAWLANATAIDKGASDAVQMLGDAAFFSHSIPQAEADADRDKLSKLEDQIESCRQRMGAEPLDKPLNPFRPLNQATDAVTGHMDNPVGAVVGVVALPVAVTLDAVDTVTRPLQVIAYPFVWAYNHLQRAAGKLGIG